MRRKQRNKEKRKKRKKKKLWNQKQENRKEENKTAKKKIKGVHGQRVKVKGKIVKDDKLGAKRNILGVGREREEKRIWASKPKSPMAQAQFNLGFIVYCSQAQAQSELGFPKIQSLIYLDTRRIQRRLRLRSTVTSSIQLSLPPVPARQYSFLWIQHS
jgi:hypothetical protein